MADDASCEKIRRIEGLSASHNPSQDEEIDEYLHDTRKLPLVRREENEERVIKTTGGKSFSCY